MVSVLLKIGSPALSYFHVILFCFLDMSEEAHNIRNLAPLPLDENFGDTRQMLARVAILFGEMLISVELQLTRGLMSKRLASKVTVENWEIVLYRGEISNNR